MATADPTAQERVSIEGRVLAWLLDSDPAIRWQVMRDITCAPGDVVIAERARVATAGWGARLLALQGEDGQWAGGAHFSVRVLVEKRRQGCRRTARGTAVDCPTGQGRNLVMPTVLMPTICSMPWSRIFGHSTPGRHGVSCGMARQAAALSRV